MRVYHAFVVSVALLVLSLGGMDLLHGGWEAVAGGLMLVSTVAATLAFVVLAAQAERVTPGSEKP
jgi:hypothetical protein